MLYLWDAFGGAVPLKPHGYRVTVALPEADLLAAQADVRVSGVTVGRVVSAGRSAVAGDRKDALLEIDAAYVPLREGVRATIRRKSLAGEEYLELSPGTRGAGAVADGGRLSAALVAPSVEIDEVLRAFDAPTRRHLETWIAEQARALDGRGDDLNAAIGALPAFAEDVTAVLAVLNRQDGALRAAVADTGVVFEALSVRGDALRGAIVNGERVTGTLARRGRELQETFRALPTFEAEARRLLARADRFQRSADPVIRALRPGARALSQAAQAIEATAPELRGLVEGLDPLTAAARRGLPATRRFVDATGPLVSAFSPFLAQLNPALEYIRPNADALNGLIAGLTAATQSQTSGLGTGGAPLHYARAGMTLNPASLAQFERLPATARTNPYPSGHPRLSASRPLAVFDDRQCSRPALWPKLAPAVPGTGISAELLGRIDHFVLNDGKVTAPRCLLQDTPAGQAFPQIRPTSHTAGGTP
jgi:phospholipid/cholesterol/gamma-HCH transport system substrate-binding protein